MATVRKPGCREERGQALVVSMVFLTALLAMAGGVVDVGSWYWQDRKLQATADASALAGAQGLVQGTAVSLSVQYGNVNGGGVTAGDVTVDVEHGTVAVSARKVAPTYFTRLFGVTSVNVKAQATARAGLPQQVRGAAPIAVDERHPKLSGAGCPCFEQPTDIDLQKTGPGAFRLVNLDRSHGGTGPGTLADWIQNGYAGWMPVDWYYSDPGAKFNSSQVKGAMNSRIGSVLLFPIYRETRGNGANFEYHVIGWAGFHVGAFDAHGNSATVSGWFESVTWEGILGPENDGSTDFGARSIELVG